MKLTPAVQAMLNRLGPAVVGAIPPPQSAEVMLRAKARPEGPKAGGMNRTEQAYASHLDLRKLAGEVASYRWESLKFRLADRTWYAPDFVVVMADGLQEIHEVKGFWEDDARVKIKVFAELYPEYRVLAVQRVEGAWKYEEFSK